MLGEPGPTSFDLNFQVAGIPVRIHPLFWLTALLLGGSGDGLILLIWVSTLFVSILIHELGHALMMRRFGIRSHIVLYLLGGLAIPDSAGFGNESRRSNPRDWVLILAAGPGAGFLLAALIVLGVVLSGGKFWLVPEDFPFFYDFELASSPDVDMRPWRALVAIMLYVNIFWGLVNLLPVFPLDGGQISRTLFMQSDPWGGMVKSLWLSVIAAGAMVLWGLYLSSFFIAIMFGMMAFQSYMTIQQISGGGGFGGRRPW